MIPPLPPIIQKNKKYDPSPSIQKKICSALAFPKQQNIPATVSVLQKSVTPRIQKKKKICSATAFPKQENIAKTISTVRVLTSKKCAKFWTKERWKISACFKIVVNGINLFKIELFQLNLLTRNMFAEYKSSRERKLVILWKLDSQSFTKWK